MKSNRPYPKATVSQKAVKSIAMGSTWVYDDDIVTMPDDINNGDIVDIISNKDKYLGTGILSLSSKIRLRIISTNTNDVFNDAFWERRIKYAWEYRKTVLKPEDLLCCRVIFGEADQIPGLTVDRYNDIIVVQIASYGIELRKDIILPLIFKVLSEDGQKISGIYERNDLSLRNKEGLEQNKGWYELSGIQHPTVTTTQIIENGIIYDVDFENGQKTGFFLDQKYNRLAAASIAKNKKILECFTHTGSFGLNVAKAGAEHVTSVDVSQEALNCARKNAQHNNLSDKIEYVCDDVFDLLTRLEKDKNSSYDYIILDPPAFTKSRSTRDSALRGYKDINYRAMRILPRGGYLATASCSHFVTNEMFINMLKSAASDAGKQLRLIEARSQAPDHPVFMNMDEGSYLKFYLLQVI